MTRRARLLLGCGLAGLLGAVPAGCGVPDSGPPVVVSSAPAAGGQDSGQQGPRTAPVPPDPATATNPNDLVQLYFTAAGVDPDPDDVQHNVSQFFAPDVRDRWHADPSGQTVVRVDRYTVTAQGRDKQDRATATVRVRGELVGVLGDDGAVQPPAGTAAHAYRQDFQLTQWPISGGGKEWLITDPPRQTLLSTEAMSSEYNPTVVYFASPDHRSLVPDLRYVSKTVVPQKERTMLVDWLLDGPSPWLAPAVVNDIPEGTKRRGNVVRQNDNNVVAVDLTSEAVGAKHPQTMAAQIAWTLRVRASRVQLRIEGRPYAVPGLKHKTTTFDTSSLRSFNAATLGANSAGYYLTHGMIVPARSGERLPAVLSAPATGGLDTKLTHAALNVDSSAAALVRTGDRGRPELWIGHSDSGDIADSRYVRADGLGAAQQVGRPSLVSNTPTALVPVDGALRMVTGAGRNEPVPFVPGSPGGAVTAVSVSPDGCRVALVRGGRLYVAPLLHTQQQLSVGRMHQLAGGFTDLTEVSWTQDGDIAFGGRGSVGDGGPLSGGVRGGAWQFSLDDVSSDLLTGTSGDRVPEYVASGTTDPSRGAAHGAILMSANGQILELIGNELAPPDGAAEPPPGTAPFFPS